MHHQGWTHGALHPLDFGSLFALILLLFDTNSDIISYTYIQGVVVVGPHVPNCELKLPWWPSRSGRGRATKNKYRYTVYEYYNIYKYVCLCIYLSMRVSVDHTKGSPLFQPSNPSHGKLWFPDIELGPRERKVGDRHMLLLR